MSATSQHTGGARSCGISYTYKPPDSKSLRFISHPLPRPISFCSASILQIVFPLKMNLGKIQGYHILRPYFPALNPLPFSHQSSVWALPRRQMLTDSTVNLSQYCLVPRGVHLWNTVHFLVLTVSPTYSHAVGAAVQCLNEPWKFRYWGILADYSFTRKSVELYLVFLPSCQSLCWDPNKMTTLITMNLLRQETQSAKHTIQTIFFCICIFAFIEWFHSTVDRKH